PLLMGCQDERPLVEEQKIIPVEKYGIKMMSLGFLLEEGQAVLWRGPMVAGTVRQLLADVKWGELDYLLVDLPPGTGDAPMTLAQLVPLSGVVIVATPQDVAANIAAKSVALFTRLKAPLLGVIENMSTFLCPHCGKETRVFAGLHGEALAERFKVPFLGAIPLDPNVSSAGDEGVPSLLAYPQSVQAQRFRSIAGQLAAEVSKAAMGERKREAFEE
ncbi:MAG: Mrp/NBP35 family ATP-binding protein, partial [Fimbriimonadales bacterium]|nr:Mrp/NBP35 family ATP-binding protein [Fimbriimonadales bacterium]